MSEQNNQPDLLDRQLIPARSKATLSREIGEAVVTETIFGKAKVRIIRKGDKMQRVLRTATYIAAGVAAVIAWQVWESSNQAAAPETEPVVGAVNPESVPASQPEAAPVLAEPAVQAVLPPQTIAVVPVAVSHSAPGAATAASSVAPAKPLVVPRPVLARPQSAPPATGTLETPLPARALPRPMPPRPAASVPAAATAIRPQVDSSPAAILPLSSPLARETTPAPAKPAAEPINP